jgi:hypothetical protein
MTDIVEENPEVISANELEKRIGHERIVPTKTSMQLNALLFSNEYTPINFVKKLNNKVNLLHPIERQKAGAGIYKYYANTLSGGYIFCVAQTEATGTRGDEAMNPVEEYFSQHKTQLSLFKHGMVLLVPAATAFFIWAITTYAMEWQFAAIVLMALNWLQMKVSALNPNAYWQGVGADKKKSPRA